MVSPTATIASAGRRMSAAARRRTILDPAIVEFAKGGYWGTSTETIGRSAGVSQPYVMRIFGTKAELFRLAFERALQIATDSERSAGHPPASTDLGAGQGRAADRHDAMMVLLHGFAHGSTDSQLHDQARAGMAALYSMALEATSALEDDEDDAPRATATLAGGLLAHLLSSMDAAESTRREPFRPLALATAEDQATGDRIAPTDGSGPFSS